jgi:hypothetical protein
MSAREKGKRPTFLEQAGGLSGLFQSSLPPVLLVLIHPWGIYPAIGCAVGVCVAVALLRAIRRQSLRPAVGGLIGVAISTAVAARTGEARDFFLPSLWLYAIAFVLLTASILLRWPLVGVICSLMRGAAMRWRADRPSRSGYAVATAFVAAVFAARFVVQHWFYVRDDMGWLTFSKIAMNYPLWALALLVVFWAVRRSDRRLSYCTR